MVAPNHTPNNALSLAQAQAAPALPADLSPDDRARLNTLLFTHRGDLTAAAAQLGCLEVDLWLFTIQPHIAPHIAGLRAYCRDLQCIRALDKLEQDIARLDDNPAERRRAVALFIGYHTGALRPPRPPRAPHTDPGAADPHTGKNHTGPAHRPDRARKQHDAPAPTDHPIGANSLAASPAALRGTIAAQHHTKTEKSITAPDEPIETPPPEESLTPPEGDEDPMTNDESAISTHATDHSAQDQTASQNAPDSHTTTQSQDKADSKNEAESQSKAESQNPTGTTAQTGEAQPATTAAARPYTPLTRAEIGPPNLDGLPLNMLRIVRPNAPDPNAPPPYQELRTRNYITRQT